MFQILKIKEKMKQPEMGTKKLSEFKFCNVLLIDNMKLFLVAFLLVPACTGYFAQIRDHLEKKGSWIKDHFEKKLKKPECHVEWEDVSTPHCETHNEQVLPGYFSLLVVWYYSFNVLCAGLCRGVPEPVQD